MLISISVMGKHSKQKRLKQTIEAIK